ncbi:hypothetical protein ACWGJ9_08950 [Curtobacterium citreum]
MTAATIGHTPEQIKTAVWVLRLSFGEDTASKQAASDLVKARVGDPSVPSFEQALHAAHELEDFAGWTDEAITKLVDEILNMSLSV